MGILVNQSSQVSALRKLPPSARSSVARMRMPTPVINRLRSVSKSLGLALVTPFALPTSTRAVHVAWPAQKVAMRFIHQGQPLWSKDQCQHWIDAGWIIHELSPSLIEQLSPEDLLSEMRELLGLAPIKKSRKAKPF